MKRESENDSPRRTQRNSISHEAHEGHEGSEIITFQFSYFVLLANFVVKYVFRFFWGLQRARSLW